ncbi:hypothetical protein VPH35_088066 [Triticum aestivum]
MQSPVVDALTVFLFNLSSIPHPYSLLLLFSHPQQRFRIETQDGTPVVDPAARACCCTTIAAAAAAAAGSPLSCSQLLTPLRDNSNGNQWVIYQESGNRVKKKVGD